MFWTACVLERKTSRPTSSHQTCTAWENRRKRTYITSRHCQGLAYKANVQMSTEWKESRVTRSNGTGHTASTKTPGTEWSFMSSNRQCREPWCNCKLANPWMKFGTKNIFVFSFSLFFFFVFVFQNKKGKRVYLSLYSWVAVKKKERKSSVKNAWYRATVLLRFTAQYTLMHTIRHNFSGLIPFNDVSPAC